MASSKVYVGSLSWNTTDSSLKSYFEEIGEIVDAVVIQDRETGRSKGFGFVEFSNSEDAQRAVDEKNNTELDGRTLRVDLAQNKPPRSEGGSRGFGGRGRGGYDRGDRGERRSYGDRGDRDSFRGRGRSGPYDREERRPRRDD